MLGIFIASFAIAPGLSASRRRAYGRAALLLSYPQGIIFCACDYSPTSRLRMNRTSADKVRPSDRARAWSFSIRRPQGANAAAAFPFLAVALPLRSFA